MGAAIVERNVYTPYGQQTVNQETAPGDYDGDQDVDATDRAAGEVGGTCRGSNPTGSCRTLDLDFDNDVDDADLTLFDNLDQGIARHPGRTTTATNQPFAHQGLLYEPELGSYQNRHRQYMPNNRHFAQRDPLAFTNSAGSGYQDGLTLYDYVRGNPMRFHDPLGNDTCTNGCTQLIGSFDYCSCIYKCRVTSSLGVFGSCLSSQALPFAGSEAVCVSGCGVACWKSVEFLPICFGICSGACGFGAALVNLCEVYYCVVARKQEIQSAQDAFCNCVKNKDDTRMAAMGFDCK